MSQDKVDIEDIADEYQKVLCREGEKELIVVTHITEATVISTLSVHVYGEEVYQNTNTKLALDEYNKR